MNRDYPDRPIVGVGVVVFRGDEVLLIKRGKPPRAGEISIPGGAQDLGETVRETARREVMEETGLDVFVTGLIDVVDIVRPDRSGKVQYHYTLVDFAAEWQGGEPRASSDAAEAFFHPINEVAGLPLWSETKRIIEKAAALRGVDPS